MPKEIFNLSVEGIIWKIYHDLCSNNFLIENRIETPRSTYFHLINPTGELLSSWEPQQENWWFNTIKFHDNCVYLTLYPNEDLPETSHLHQYDTKTGELLKIIEDCNIVYTDNREIRYTDKENATQSITLLGTDNHSLLSPHLYSKETSYFETVKKFISQEQEIEPVESIEYLEQPNSIIISYYLYNENKKLDNYLVALDSEGEIIYQDCVSENDSGVGTDSFFILENRVYFTKNKTSFVCITL